MEKSEFEKFMENILGPETAKKLSEAGAAKSAEDKQRELNEQAAKQAGDMFRAFGDQGFDSEQAFDLTFMILERGVTKQLGLNG